MPLDFLELINSEHIQGPGRVDDYLANPQWLDQKMKAWGVGFHVSKVELGRLRRLRLILRTAIEELMDLETLTDETLSQINEFLSGITYVTALEKDDEQRIIVSRQLSEQTKPSVYLAHCFVEYMSMNDMQRLKLCRNNDCRWAFIDGTKNRSKKWCESSSCGNLTKVRAFRARKKLN